VTSLVSNRCRLPGLPRVAALAYRFRLPGLSGARRLASGRRALQVHRVRCALLRHRRNDLRPHTHAPDPVVHRLLAVRHRQGRDRCAESEAVARCRFLSDRVGHASPAEGRARSSRARAPGRHRGGRRDRHRRSRSWSGSRQRQGRQGLDGHRGGDQGTLRLRPMQARAAGRRLGCIAARLRLRSRRARRHGHHGRLERQPWAGPMRLHP